MKRVVWLLLMLGFLAAPAISAQDDAELLAQAAATLRRLETLDHYAVTWEIENREWIATFEDGELVAGRERHLAMTYVDHFIAGDDYFNFQRIAAVIEERLEEDVTVQYTAEIRIVDGTIYVRAEVLEGEMSRGYPSVWRVWKWPDQWSVFGDLLPHTYFAAVEANSPLPLFDLSAETIDALTADPTYVRTHGWPWYDTHAQTITIDNSSGENTARVLATRPSLDPHSPFVNALLDYLSPGAEELVQLYFDVEDEDILLGLLNGRHVEAANVPLRAFEDGAPDSQTMYYSNIRLSHVDFRNMDADFAPVDAPPP